MASILGPKTARVKVDETVDTVTVAAVEVRGYSRLTPVIIQRLFLSASSHDVRQLGGKHLAVVKIATKLPQNSVADNCCLSC